MNRLVMLALLSALAAAAPAGAEEPVAPVPAPRPGLVASPKDGRPLTVMRRASSEERLNAAVRARQRRQEAEKAGLLPPATKGPAAAPRDRQAAAKAEAARRDAAVAKVHAERAIAAPAPSRASPARAAQGAAPVPRTRDGKSGDQAGREAAAKRAEGAR